MRIEPADLFSLGDRHRARERLASGIASGEQPVFPADADRPHGALVGIVIDRDPPILNEQCERCPAVEAIVDRLGQIALAGDGVQLSPRRGIEVSLRRDRPCYGLDLPGSLWPEDVDKGEAGFQS